MREKFIYLPTASSGPSTTSSPRAPEPVGRYPCPCCGHITLPVPKEDAIAYICPVCFWENDVFLTGDAEPSDENHGLTLQEGRKNYQTFGACSLRLTSFVRPPKPEEMPE